MQKVQASNVPHMFSLQHLAYQAVPSSIREMRIQQSRVPRLPDTMKDSAKEVRIGFRICFNQKLTWKSEDEARDVGFTISPYGNPIGYDIDGPNISCMILDRDLQNDSDFPVAFSGCEIPTIQGVLNELNKLCHEEISLAIVEYYKITSLNKMIHCGLVLLNIQLSFEDGLDLQQVIQFWHQSDVWQWQTLLSAPRFEDHFSKVFGTKISIVYIQPLFCVDATTEVGRNQLALLDEEMADLYD